MPCICVVEGCGSKLRNWSDLKFHTLPIKNPDQLRQWILAFIDPGDSAKCISAIIIFHENYAEFTNKTGKKVSKDTAIPSLDIPVRADAVSDYLVVFLIT